ncbi:MAG TPA: extradiol ring-cleavage dioxygenase, partial [Mycobacterium sp.]|nr:extradiol ring-cleavage dioxygenase [Mycobacterium sp.]
MTSDTLAPSVFGSVHLGYVVIETYKFAAWTRFGRDAIGMQLDEMVPDTIRFRLDANECRFP